MSTRMPVDYSRPEDRLWWLNPRPRWQRVFSTILIGLFMIVVLTVKAPEEEVEREAGVQTDSIRHPLDPSRAPEWVTEICTDQGLQYYAWLADNAGLWAVRCIDARLRWFDNSRIEESAHGTIHKT